jgi:hypothetical protein
MQKQVKHWGDKYWSQHTLDAVDCFEVQRQKYKPPHKSRSASLMLTEEVYWKA